MSVHTVRNLIFLPVLAETILVPASDSETSYLLDAAAMQEEMERDGPLAKEAKGALKPVDLSRAAVLDPVPGFFGCSMTLRMRDLMWERAARWYRANGATYLLPAASQTMKMTAATFMALSVSIDDAVWLLPFVLSERWLHYSACYVSVRLLMLFLSVTLSMSVKSVVMGFVSQDHMQLYLQLGSCLLLTTYAIKLYLDWYWKRSEHHQARKETGPSASTVSDPCAEADVKALSGDGLGVAHLYMIAILGNFDNIALFTPLMVSGVFSAMQLLAGVLCAAVSVVTLLLSFSSISKCGGPLRWLESLPLWCIVGGWALWSGLHLVYR